MTDFFQPKATAFQPSKFSDVGKKKSVAGDLVSVQDELAALVQKMTEQEVREDTLSTPVRTVRDVLAVLRRFASGGSGGTGGGGGGSGTVTEVTGTDGIGVANGTTTPQLSLDDITPTSVVASGNVSGANLSGTNTGDQTITLQGDVTGTGTGTFTATIANDAVTYAKMQNVSATDKLLGRSSSGAGDVEEIACTAAGRAILDDADAAAQRTTLLAAARTQTQECIAGFIASPSNKDYKLVVKMPHAGTITETTTICVSGTITATFKINTTALGGTANSVSSSEQSQSHASSNTFSAGDDIVLTGSSNSSCVDMSFTIKYTRTLE